VDFDEAFFMAGVRAQNPEVPVFKVSAKNGGGLDVMATWLGEREKSARA
jgi:Ni2+-binding GTPase involved in maturation of urease and hydrogenase